jgi:uncharacterized iron-regulated membrane protein
MLRLDDSRSLSLAEKILKSIEPLHLGKPGGWPHKLLWFVLGLTPGFLMVSGVMMCWNRTRGLRKNLQR